MSAVPIANDLSPKEAFLLGSILEGPLLGINVVLYVATVRKLYQTKNAHLKLLIAIATLQFLVAIGNFVANVVDVFDGFVTSHIDPDAWFVNPTRVPYEVGLWLFSTNYSTGDAIVAWRCWMIWGRNRFIGVVFIVLVIGVFICGYSGAGHIVTLTDGQAIFAIYRWTVGHFALSLAIQFSATALIVWKIWRTTFWSPGNHSAERLAIIWIIVESGAILTANTIALLVFFVRHMNVGQIMSGVIAQLSFMVPMSIIIRAAPKRHGKSTQNVALLNYKASDSGSPMRMRTRGENTSNEATTSIPGSIGTLTQSTQADTKIDMDVTLPPMPMLDARHAV